MTKILIIEDDENMGKILEKFFQLKGFDVGWVRDGAVGLSEMTMMSPDVVLLDLEIPSMDGYQVLEARAKDSELLKIPVILISNSGQLVQSDRLDKLSVSDRLIKANITPEEVFESVNKVLGKASNPTSSTESIIDVEGVASEGVNLKGTSVLWVEDDMFLASIVSRKLAATGANYSLAKSGEEAYVFLEKSMYDAIILDLVLPGASGFEILEKIKANERTKPIPVIVLSNLDQRNDMEKCFKLGASKFFVKALVGLDRIFEEIKALAKKPSV